MKLDLGATCVSCEVHSSDLDEYDPIDNPVEDDGTYENGKFVCTQCYCRLIDLRDGNFKPDIGTPSEVQKNAKYMLKPKEGKEGI